MIKCIIIDDEYPARILLKEFVEKVPTLELIGSFKSGLEALSTIQSERVDLMFLDIQMPDITGINFLKMLGNIKPYVIFTTAYSEYAIESYQLDVVDYLLKPFSFDRFMQAIGKIMSRNALNNPTNTSNNTTNAQQQDSDYGVLLLKQDRMVHRVRYDSILYIEGYREYITIFCKDEKIMSLETLKNMEDMLPSSLFMRVHKSYIVRLDMIKSLSTTQIFIEGVKDPIPIGRQYADTIKEMYNLK